MNRQRRRCAAAALALALATLPGAGPLLAQTAQTAQTAAWPTRPVRLVVPAPAGTAPDVTARIVGERLSRLWGQTVIVEDRPGAGGLIAFTAMKSADRDDHQLAFVPASAVVLSPYMYRSAGVDIVRDLVPVAFIGETPMVLAVGAASPIQSFAELMAEARRQPNALVGAFPLQYSVPHLTTDLLSKSAGVQIRAVPFAGSTQATTAVIGGDAQIVIDGLPALESLIRSGRLKPLATFSARRLPKQPGLPAVAETYPDMVVNGWFGVLALAGTSPAIIDRVNRDIATVLAAPDIAEKLETSGLFARPLSPAAFGRFLSSERARWEKALKDVGAQPVK